MGTADAPTSKRLHLRGVDKDTLPKVVRAIASSPPWRAACMEFARRTDYGERSYTTLPQSDLAPMLGLLLQAVEQNVTFGGSASIQDLAKLGCPGALLNVLEMQVKKAAQRGRGNTGEEPRVAKRPTTNPQAMKRKTTTGPGKKAQAMGGSAVNTMSVFSVRRILVTDRDDAKLTIRVDGIMGGEDQRIPCVVDRGKAITEQIRELELRAKMTFVPEGRLHDLISRELSVGDSA